jgi:hypothetical protein
VKNLPAAEFPIPPPCEPANPPPQTLIVVGFDTSFLANFQDCTLIAPITTPFNIQNEETIDHRAIYVCHNLRQPWPQFWKTFQYFG